MYPWLPQEADAPTIAGTPCCFRILLKTHNKEHEAERKREAREADGGSSGAETYTARSFTAVLI